jgi:hypothetical protein
MPKPRYRVLYIHVYGWSYAHGTAFGAHAKSVSLVFGADGRLLRTSSSVVAN